MTLGSTLTRTAAGGGSSSGFAYGKAGQFTQGPAGSYAYGSFPAHAPSSTTENGTTTDYSYNAAGDRTRARLPQVTWNALGQAHTIQAGNGTTLTLTYGPDGGLVNNSGLGGGRYLGAFLKWTDTTDWSARIIVQGRVIAVVKDSRGSVSTAYLLQGPLGSTAAVATGSGSLTQRIAYGAWGQFVHPATGTGSVSPTTVAQATTVTYTGHELIAGANLINMGARLYDPATGLFMSPDPTVAYPYNSQDLNQYAYVNDNPLTYVDPSGFNPSCASDPPGPCDLPPISAVTCDLSCIGGMLDDGMLQLYMTGGRGPGGFGGGGGGGSGTTAHSKQTKKKQCNKGNSGNQSQQSNIYNNPVVSSIINSDAMAYIGIGAAIGGVGGTAVMGRYLARAVTAEAASEEGATGAFLGAEGLMDVPAAAVAGGGLPGIVVGGVILGGIYFAIHITHENSAENSTSTNTCGN